MYVTTTNPLVPVTPPASTKTNAERLLEAREGYKLAESRSKGKDLKTDAVFFNKIEGGYSVRLTVLFPNNDADAPRITLFHGKNSLDHSKLLGVYELPTTDVDTAFWYAVAVLDRYVRVGVERINLPPFPQPPRTEAPLEAPKVKGKARTPSRKLEVLFAQSDPHFSVRAWVEPYLYEGSPKLENDGEPVIYYRLKWKKASDAKPTYAKPSFDTAEQAKECAEKLWLSHLDSLREEFGSLNPPLPVPPRVALLAQEKLFQPPLTKYAKQRQWSVVRVYDAVHKGLLHDILAGIMDTILVQSLSDPEVTSLVEFLQTISGTKIKVVALDDQDDVGLDVEMIQGKDEVVTITADPVPAAAAAETALEVVTTPLVEEPKPKKRLRASVDEVLTGLRDWIDCGRQQAVEAATAGLQAKVAELSEALAAKDAEIAAKDKALADKDAEVKALRAKIKSVLIAVDLDSAS